MLKTENFQTYGWESAVRGMRNPMNSWEKSDSEWCLIGTPGTNQAVANDKYLREKYCIGPNDLDLMKRLRKGGPDDRKYLRQIFVSVDITAPLYWWKEMDQYKVGTVTNSCSTMHKISAKKFTIDDFSHEHLDRFSLYILNTVINTLNISREDYIENNKERQSAIGITQKHDWWQMIQLLPSSYNQKRTWTANYEVLCNIYNARKNHKLDEWHTFCDAITNLPYAKELIIGGDQE